MVFNIKNIIYSVAICISLCGLNTYSQTTSVQPNYVFIGNEVSVKNISLKEIKKVFLGEKVFWDKKTRIILVLPSSKNKLAPIVSSNIYGMTVMGMQKYWLALTFQGTSNPPLFSENDEETIKYVESNKGAIGIILETNLLKTKAEKITIIN